MNSEIYHDNVYPNNIKTEENNNYYKEAIPTPITNNHINYIQDLLKTVIPIKATFFMTFPGSSEWPDKKFSGIIESSSLDHIILSDPSNGNSYMLPTMYINFVEFEEDIKKYLKN
jgi:Spore coat protein (Spore_GerQ).